MSLDVSPTYVSGDYFAPFAKPKKILPRRRTKEKWGFDAKSYGGIGVLVFNKTDNVGRKGLLLSRSHHHVGSGIHKFHAVPQPYQVTSTGKSACRPTDQLLPDVYQVDFLRIVKEFNLLSNTFAKQSCFEPILDVFPRFDISPDDTHNKAGEPLSKRKSLGTKTLRALQDIAMEIYKTSYQRDYPMQMRDKQPEENQSEPLATGTQAMRQTKDTSHEFSTQLNEANPRCVVCGCQISVNDFAQGLTDVSICNYCKCIGIFRLNTKKESTAKRNSNVKASSVPFNLPDIHCLSGSKANSTINSTSKPETKASRLRTNCLLKSSKTPSEFTKIHTSPLNYLGYYSGRHRNRLSALIRECPHVETGVEKDSENARCINPPNELQPEKRIDLKRITIPASLQNKEFLKEKGIHCSELFLQKESCRKKPCIKNVLPTLYFPISSETKETTNKNETKNVEKSTMNPLLSPPAVIKRLKSDAHQRYHESYPDKIPDLRESRSEGRKYFFSGNHSSVFRG